MERMITVCFIINGTGGKIHAPRGKSRKKPMLFAANLLEKARKFW